MIQAHVVTTPLLRALANLTRVDLRPAWRDMRKPLRQDIRDHRAKKAGPDGTWPARASSTRVRAAKGRRRPRQLLGKLPTALALKSTRMAMQLKSRVPWSNIHKRGGIAGKGAVIRRRDFLWASDRVLNQIAGAIAKTIWRSWTKRR